MMTADGEVGRSLSGRAGSLSGGWDASVGKAEGACPRLSVVAVSKGATES